MKLGKQTAASFDRIDGDEKVWVAFEGAHKAKVFHRADLEQAEKDTEQDIKESLLENYYWACDRFENGDVLALYDVLQFAEELQTPLPKWASNALKLVLVNGVLGKPIAAKRPGRHSTDSKMYSDELKAYLRYDTVSRVRSYQALPPCLFSFLILPVGLKRIYSGKAPPDLGHTFEHALDAAHQSLAGTFAQCSIETLRKAFRNRGNSIAGSWAAASIEAQEALGVEVDTGDYLPSGRNNQFQPHIKNMPSQLGVEHLGLEVDAASQRVINAAQNFEYFDDFIAAARSGQVVL